MKAFEVGQSVMIPCSVAPGAFDGEALVTVDLMGEKIEGFVKNEFLRDNAIQGTIVEIGQDSLTVRLPGSFFTKAAGRALVPTDWATKNLELIPTTA